MLNPALFAVSFLLVFTTTGARAVSVRLVGGPFSQEGRLVVFYNGTWGTVCDDRFTDAAANVVCSMLGYGQGQVIGNRYGGGSGRIWLDDIQCNGTETSIAYCQHRGWGRHDCDHNEDVSVSCTTARLTGGPSPVVSCVTDSPVRLTTTPPTSTKKIEGGNDGYMTIVIVVAAVGLVLIVLLCICIVMTYRCCRRNRVQEGREQPTFPLQETSSNIIRPPPTAPSAPDYSPPPYTTNPYENT